MCPVRGPLRDPSTLKAEIAKAATSNSEQQAARSVRRPVPPKFGKPCTRGGRGLLSKSGVAGTTSNLRQISIWCSSGWQIGGAGQHGADVAASNRNGRQAGRGAIEAVWRSIRTARCDRVEEGVSRTPLPKKVTNRLWRLSGTPPRAGTFGQGAPKSSSPATPASPSCLGGRAARCASVLRGGQPTQWQDLQLGTSLFTAIFLAQ